VRELFWVISHRRAIKGILVTSGYFTNAARDFAHQNGIELVEGHQLADMIHSVRNAEKGGAVSDPVAEVR
jgi:restriction system protein